MRDDWRAVTLGEVAVIEMGQSPEGSKCNREGVGSPLLNGPTEFGPAHPTPAQWTTDPRKVANAGDVLFCVRGSTTGRMNVADQEYAIGRGVAAIRGTSVARTGFVHLVLQHRLSELLQITTGSTFPNLSRESIAGVEFVLPPLVVQRRIVDLMHDFDEHIDRLRAERETASAMVAAAAEWLLWATDAPTLRLGDTLAIARGGSPRPIDAYFTDAPDGLNWIKIGDIAPGGKFITATAQRIRPEGLSKTRQVHAGDFLLSNSMSFGRPYILKIDGCIHDGWLVLGNVEASFDRDYLYYLLRSASVQAAFATLAAGSGVKNLNIKSVESVQVPVPELAEQRAISTALSAQTESIDALDSEIHALSQFRSALLQQLLMRSFDIAETVDSLNGSAT